LAARLGYDYGMDRVLGIVGFTLLVPGLILMNGSDGAWQVLGTGLAALGGLLALLANALFVMSGGLRDFLFRGPEDR
jgi:hypothetical protein